MSGEPSKYPEANAAWGCWPIVCFALPAALLWLVKKIASSFRRHEMIEQPPQPKVSCPPATPRPMTRRERFREAYWPLIYDQASAKRAAHQAAWAAFLGSGVSGVLAYLAIFK